MIRKRSAASPSPELEVTLSALLIVDTASVAPAADGLARIRARTTARRRPSQWLIGLFDRAARGLA